MGGPLDVHTPLRSAREHATKSFVAWLLPAVAIMLITQPMPKLFGWPDLAYRVEGEVIDAAPSDGGDVVTFEASGGGKTVRWERFFDGSGWSVGDRVEGWVDTEGVYYGGFGPDWAGPVELLYFLVAGMALFFAARRLFALVLAKWDLAHPSDAPVRGYVALVRNPLPQTWRDVLLVWHDRPGTTADAHSPDRTFLADDETGDDLRSDVGELLIWEAWIDTGRLRWSKPRWIGVRDGILIPHRRALLGGWSAEWGARKRDRSSPVPMPSGPPDPSPSVTSAHPQREHSFPKMLAGRTLLEVSMAALIGLVANGEAVVSVVG